MGGGLAVSGASYQTLFKNPMVSPDILGVSAGAGFGAALAMLGSGSWAQIQLSALVFGLAAVAAAYLIGSVYGKAEVTTLVLAGVIVSSLFQRFYPWLKHTRIRTASFHPLPSGLWAVWERGTWRMWESSCP